MRDVSIARNYSEALLALARKAKDTARWGALISALGDAVASNATLRHFLEAPQVSATQKSAILGKALGTKAAPNFVRFVQKLVTNRRQMLLPEIATEYHNLLDEAEGRVHARVTVSREVDQPTSEAIGNALTKALKKIVVPHLTVDARILGGVVLRAGRRRIYQSCPCCGAVPRLSPPSPSWPSGVISTDCWRVIRTSMS